MKSYFLLIFMQLLYYFSVWKYALVEQSGLQI